MTQRIDCDEALLQLELGDEPTAGTERHLQHCESCRIEADRLQTVFSNLAGSRSISPSPLLDRTVRALIAGDGGAGVPFPRPLVAAGLGAAACLALVAALSVGLAGAGAAENGPLLAVLAVSAWLAVSAAATLPLVLFQRRLNTARSLG